MTMRIGYRHADRLISYPYAHNLSMKQQPIRVDTMRGNRCTSSACDALAAEQCNATPHSAIPTYPVQYPRAMRSIANPGSTAGMEGAGGSGGHGCGTHGRRQGLAGLRGEVPPHTAPQAPPVWRAPEGPEGTAAEPVGGGGAWPGFETTRRAKLAARTARGRAAAHGHTKQPGLARHTTRATGPDGAQNISGATSNKTARPGCRRARLRCPWAAAGPGWASRRRAERSSQRGRLAGGPPPTGTPSSPA